MTWAVASIGFASDTHELLVTFDSTA